MTISFQAASGAGFAAKTGQITVNDVAPDDRLLVWVTIKNTASQIVSSVTDSAGNTYSNQDVQNNGTSVREELWTTKHVPVAQNVTITVTLSAAADFAIKAVRYGGVGGFIALAKTTGNSASPSVSAVTEASTDWIAAGVGADGAISITAGPGENQRATQQSATGVQIARPDSTVTAGGWTAVGAATLHEAVDEATANDDTDYDEKTGSGGMELGLGDLVDPVSSSGHTVRFRAKQQTGSGGAEQLTVALFEGALQRATTTVTLTRGAYGSFAYTLTAAEANSIVDYTNLRLRFTPSQGAGEVMRVTWAEFEVPNAPDVTGGAGDNSSPTGVPSETVSATLSASSPWAIITITMSESLREWVDWIPVVIDYTPVAVAARKFYERLSARTETVLSAGLLSESSSDLRLTRGVPASRAAWSGQNSGLRIVGGAGLKNRALQKSVLLADARRGAGRSAFTVSETRLSSGLIHRPSSNIRLRSGRAADERMVFLTTRFQKGSAFARAWRRAASGLSVTADALEKSGVGLQGLVETKHAARSWLRPQEARSIVIQRGPRVLVNDLFTVNKLRQLYKTVKRKGSVD